MKLSSFYIGSIGGVGRIGTLSVVFTFALLTQSACEDVDREIIQCGTWTGSLTKYYEGDELVSCSGYYIPECHFEDGTILNDSTAESEIEWKFYADCELTLNSVEWNEYYQTSNTAIIEAEIIDGSCGEGTLFFVVEDDNGALACDGLNIAAGQWESAGEVFE